MGPAKLAQQARIQADRPESTVPELKVLGRLCRLAGGKAKKEKGGGDKGKKEAAGRRAKVGQQVVVCLY